MKPKLLWVSDQAAPPNVRQAVAEEWDLSPYLRNKPLAPQLSVASLAVVCPNGKANDSRYIVGILDELQRTAAVALFMLPAHAETAAAILSRVGGQVICLNEDSPAGEISAALSAAAALQPTINDLRAEVSAARYLGAGAVATNDELTEEMRLAARLQRDFLPRRLPEVGSARFGVVYCPAGWVSGDIYDVMRLDETHVGFYVADAVGHGMPAALLTMFIKKALLTKRIIGLNYQIVPPHESLQAINKDICEQNLSNCQFCTAVYCVFDTQELTLTYARAGHPEPILIHADGTGEKLVAPGTLLGVFPQERYQCEQCQLRPGDRLLMFTDGAERALFGDVTNIQATPADKLIQPWTGLARDELLLGLTGQIESQRDRGEGDDDITVMVMDVEG